MLVSIEFVCTLAIPLLWVGALILENVLGGERPFPRIRFWFWAGLAGFITAGALSALLPPLIAPHLAWARMTDLSSLGSFGAAPTLLLTTFLTYWNHRAAHAFDIYWRFGHQLHHAVARVDATSAVMLHPTEIALQIVFATLAASVLGVSGEAAAIAGAAGFFLAVSQHINIRTPHWLGYVIQRPEAHCLHHERGVHARNFGDLPIWDMAFGTFANPRHLSDVRAGFEPETGRRVLSMLLFKDVHADRKRERETAKH